MITDGATCEKMTIFEEFGNRIKTGNTYFMRGHTLRGRQPPYYLNITKTTMFFKTCDMNVTEELRQEARALLLPRSYATPLSECSSLQGLLTVEGQVIEASFFHGF